MSEPRESTSALSALRRFARPRPRDVEVCGLCGAAVPPAHEHLIDPAARQLECACGACAILFAGQAKWRRVRRRVERLHGFVLDDAQWNALAIPIRLAFFTHSSAAGRVVAFYPSPAGAAEAWLPPQAWAELVAANPVLASLEPDVEALLVDRARGAERHYRVSIDECYRVVGLIKLHWRGLGGGAEVWTHLDRFFAELDGGAACPT
ncbi:MAG TPA: DUF5947 family protein [Polyangia bacterium]|nr:DUF5947 family protein [Polyangia bacterium]